jgi:hypothetical protein
MRVVGPLPYLANPCNRVRTLNLLVRLAGRHRTTHVGTRDPGRAEAREAVGRAARGARPRQAPALASAAGRRALPCTRTSPPSASSWLGPGYWRRRGGSRLKDPGGADGRPPRRVAPCQRRGLCHRDGEHPDLAAFVFAGFRPEQARRCPGRSPSMCRYTISITGLRRPRHKPWASTYQWGMHRVYDGASYPRTNDPSPHWNRDGESQHLRSLMKIREGFCLTFNFRDS